MKAFENLTIKQVKKEIVAWETDMGREAKSIFVSGIMQNEDDAEQYEEDDTTYERFVAFLVIDGEKICRGYEWDINNEDITAAWDVEFDGTTL